VSDHHSGPGGLPSLRPRRCRSRHAVSAQSEGVVVGLAHTGCVERVPIHVVIIGRRVAIVRLASRALKALRATLVPLRPR
jgi:hypothetical protein